MGKVENFVNEHFVASLAAAAVAIWGMGKLASADNHPNRCICGGSTKVLSWHGEEVQCLNKWRFGKLVHKYGRGPMKA